MADRHHRGAADAVEIAPPLVVIKIDALAAHDPVHRRADIAIEDRRFDRHLAPPSVALVYMYTGGRGGSSRLRSHIQR